MRGGAGPGAGNLKYQRTNQNQRVNSIKNELNESLLIIRIIVVVVVVVVVAVEVDVATKESLSIAQRIFKNPPSDSSRFFDWRW